MAAYTTVLDGQAADCFSISNCFNRLTSRFQLGMLGTPQDLLLTTLAQVLSRFVRRPMLSCRPTTRSVGNVETLAANGSKAI